MLMELRHGEADHASNERAWHKKKEVLQTKNHFCPATAIAISTLQSVLPRDKIDKMRNVIFRPVAARGNGK